MNFKIILEQKLFFVGILITLSCFQVNAQNEIWSKTKTNNKTSDVLLNNLDNNYLEVFDLNMQALRKQLKNTPLRGRSNGSTNTIVTFPDEKGNDF